MSDYKTEVDRTERLSRKVKETTNQITNELNKDSNINISSLSSVTNAIRKAKDNRYAVGETVLSDNFTVDRVERGNMKEIWTRNFGSIRLTALGSDDNYLYVGRKNGDIIKVNKNGDEIKRFSTGYEQVNNIKTDNNENLFVIVNKNKLAMFNRNGIKMWEKSFKYLVVTTCYSDNYLYVCHENRYVSKINKNGDIVKNYDLTDRSFHRIYVENGYMYVGNAYGECWVFDSYGTKLSSCDIKGGAAHSIDSIGNGIISLYCANDSVSLVSTTGEFMGNYGGVGKNDGKSLVDSQGFIYVSGDYGSGGDLNKYEYAIERREWGSPTSYGLVLDKEYCFYITSSDLIKINNGGYIKNIKITA